MGPDENNESKLILTPINPDGTYGDSFTWYGFSPIMGHLETTTYMETFNFLTETISGTLKLYLPQKMSRKKFKKWLMSRGIDRDFAEWFCKAVKSFHGKKSYRSLCLYGQLAPTPQALFNDLFDALFPITNNKESEE